MDDQKTRVALVMGNSDYGPGDQVSGKKDAQEMQALLSRLGFKVLDPVLDGKFEKSQTALADFKTEIAGADIVVFFYSGHGVQLKGRNFLIPTDGTLNAGRLLAVDDILQLLGAADGAIKLVFLDACREETALPEGAPQGLANPGEAPTGVLQAFAASPGQLAASGLPEELSLYTKALLKYMPMAGLDLGKMFDKVRADVLFYSPEGQQPIEAGAMPQDFFFQPAVTVHAEIAGGKSDLLVFLRSQLLLATSKAENTDLFLNAGDNELLLLVSSNKSFHNNHDWDVSEGWSYKLKLTLPDGKIETFSGSEDHPFKNGPHHGKVFKVARVNLQVNTESAALSLVNPEKDLANQEAPFFARDQELLFEASIASLNLTPDDILGNAVDLGNAGAILRPFLVEFLKSGTVLGQTIADPSRTFITVWGNKALKSFVVTAMTQGLQDRIRDLKDSITEAFKRNPTPFALFDQRLIEAVRTAAQGSGIPVDDIQVWTALDDRSNDVAAVAPPAAVVDAGVRPAMLAAVAGLPTLASTAPATPAGILQPRPDEVPVGPIPFSQTVRGITLSTPVSFFLSFNPQGSQILVNARILADLSDLQRKVGSLVDTIPLPSDRCAHTGVDNLVSRIWGKDITIAGNVATLTLHGDVDVWGCLNVFGLHQEKQLGNQPFDATLPFSAAVADPHTIAAHVGQPSITLGGQFGSVTQWLLGSLGVNLNAMAREALNGFLSPELLRQTLPNDLLTLNPDITRAELMSNSGALALYVEMSASFDGTALGKLIRSIFVGS